jgi:hypothetical protein
MRRTPSTTPDAATGRGNAEHPKNAFFGDPDSPLRIELPEQDERRQSDPDDCRAQRRELPAIEVAQRRQRLIRLDTHDLPPNHELPLPAPAQPFAAGVFELGQRNGISRGLRAARSVSRRV